MKTEGNAIKGRLHLEAFERKMGELNAVRWNDDVETILLQQVIYYGVKTIAGNQYMEPKTVEEALACFQTAHTVLQLIGVLTPEQLEEIFPIDKTYDGERWEVKDYFFTRDILNKLPQDEMISEYVEPFELLMDYENIWLRVFLVQYMHYGDCIRRAQGKKSAAAEWSEMNGISTYTMHADQSGKKFVMESGTGKVLPVEERKPQRPKWIHVVKPVQRSH